MTKQITLIDLACDIAAHLKRFAADPLINVEPARVTTMMGPLPKPYINPRVTRTKGGVCVVYVDTTLGHALTRAEAEAYLAWLDASNVGTHLDMAKRAIVKVPVVSPVRESNRNSNVRMCECIFCGAFVNCALQNGEGICKRCAEWAIGQLQGEGAQ